MQVLPAHPAFRARDNTLSYFLLHSRPPSIQFPAPLERGYAYLTAPVNSRIVPPLSGLSSFLENETRDFQSRCRYLIFTVRTRFKPERYRILCACSAPLHALHSFFQFLYSRELHFYSKSKNFMQQ